MVAGEAGKIGIIRRAKEVATAPVIRYKDARKALKAALLQPGRASGIIEGAVDSLQQRADDPSRKRSTRDDAEKSIDAINAFPRLANELAGYEYSDPGNRLPLLNLSDVEVSVNLDLTAQRNYRGKQQIGGLIFRMTKPEEEETDFAKSKRENVGAYAATLIYMQVKANFAGNMLATPALCWSVDVQNGEIYKAPARYKRRANDMEAACQMIAAMWDRL